MNNYLHDLTCNNEIFVVSYYYYFFSVLFLMNLGSDVFNVIIRSSYSVMIALEMSHVGDDER